MKKIMSLLLGILLISASFAGCGQPAQSGASQAPSAAESSAAPSASQQSESAAEPAASEEKSKVSFWYIAADMMEEYVAGGFADRFAEAYPNRELELEMIAGTAADFETKFNAAKMSGTLPDLCYLTLTSFASLGTRGEFMPIEDRVNAWSDKDDFLEAALNMGKIDGKFTGVGVAPAPVVLCYRTDMFEAAGLDPAKPPSTWDELADYAEKLTVKDGSGNITQAGLDIPSIDYYLNVSEPFMLMNDAVVVDEAARQPLLTEPAVIETLEYLYGIYSKGVTLPHDWQKRETVPFMNGVSAMSFLGVDNYNRLIADKPEIAEYVKMAPPVSNKKASAFCGYRLLAMTAGTQNADGAWDLIDFFTSADEMKGRISACNVIPVRKSIQSEYVAAYPDNGQIVVDTVAVGKGAFVVPWVATLYKYYGPAYEAIIQGKSTPADAMAEAQKQILAEIG